MFRSALRASVSFLFAVVLIHGGCQEPEDVITLPATNGDADDNSDGTPGAPDGGVPDSGLDGADLMDAADAPGGMMQPGSGGATVDAADDSGGVDAAPVLDAPPPPDGLPPIDAPPETPPPLPECPTPSIDRLQFWWVASDVKAVTMPVAGSNTLTPEGNHQVSKVMFVGGGWHAVAVWVTNSALTQVDLTDSAGFTLTYSATADFWVQLREVANYNNGGHFVVAIPGTGGQLQTVFVPFAADKWTTLPNLGKPTVAFTEAMTQVRALFLIGNADNALVVSGLRIDNFAPDCR